MSQLQLPSYQLHISIYVSVHQIYSSSSAFEYSIHLYCTTNVAEIFLCPWCQQYYFYYQIFTTSLCYQNNLCFKATSSITPLLPVFLIITTSSSMATNLAANRNLSVRPVHKHNDQKIPLPPGCSLPSSKIGT